MSNQTNSDYFSPSATTGTSEAKLATQKTSLTGVSANITPDAKNFQNLTSAPKTMGANAEPYGLGKPRRVVIRGKISHG